MTVEQIYEKTAGDYNGACMRLRKHSLIVRLLKLFPADPSMEELNAAVAKNDQAGAFRAVHTLKGVALNLGFTTLGTAASELTELLRGGNFSQGWEESYKKVQTAYAEMLEALNQLEE